MKRANVERTLGVMVGAIASIVATTLTDGAGAGVCTRCTVTWETAQSEQSAWFAVPSEWLCAACTVPETTASTTHTTARRTLHEQLLPRLCFPPIPEPTIPRVHFARETGSPARTTSGSRMEQTLAR